ncbi:MAG TPA: DsrE family protein [Gallionellaceae bacterium]|nr:DsrE family protein [Gallionellaceae bacterium]
MKTLFILNDPPYGTERSYNGFRLARALSKHQGNEIRVFLLGDAAMCGKAGQKVPEGYYNIEFFAQSILRSGAEIGACGACLEARGIRDEELISGVKHSTLEHLAEWTEWADKVLVF